MSNERFYPKTIIKTFVLFFSKIFVKEVWEIERIPSDSHKRVNVSILNYLKNWAIDEVKMQQEYCWVPKDVQHHVCNCFNEWYRTNKNVFAVNRHCTSVQTLHHLTTIPVICVCLWHDYFKNQVMYEVENLLVFCSRWWARRWMSSFHLWKINGLYIPVQCRPPCDWCSWWLVIRLCLLAPVLYLAIFL